MKSLLTVDAVTDRLGELLGDREAAGDALFEAAKRLTLEHAAHLRQLGPVRVLALDPCPRCDGRVVASESVARCTRCDFTVAGGAR